MIEPGTLSLISFNGIERVCRYEHDTGPMSVLTMFMRGHTIPVYVPAYWYHNIEDITIPALVSGHIFKKVTQYKFERLDPK